MKIARTVGALLAAAGAGFVCGCDHGGTEAPAPDASAPVDPSTLYDPAVCRTCHADHFTQWSGSMHAYASQDPVFLAMNARGQRETNGALGPFCVKCHAPMAVLLGKTADGLNLPDLNAACASPTNPTGCAYVGVTCYFCHSIESVDTAHPFNAGVTLASDGVMRGEYTNPVPNGVHGAKYSPYHDRVRPESAAMCGACHDIVTPAGAHIERTFAEWEASPFSDADAGEGQVTTCAASGCHMIEDPQPRAIATPPIAPKGGLPLRHFSEHDFPAVDRALTPFPNAQPEQQAVGAKLANGIQGALCVTRAGGIRVILDTVNLGHDFPSGASQDRRLWTEVIAYDGANNILYQSGVVPNGMSPVDVGKMDPDMWLLRDCMFGSDGGLVDMFWQGATTEGNELPPIQAFLPSQAAYNSHKVRFFPRDGTPISQVPASVTLRVRLQPIGIEVLNDLVSTGDLDGGVVAALPPPIDIALGSGAPTTLVWTPAAAADGGVMPYEDMNEGSETTCVGTLANPANQFVAPSHTNPACSP